ncbi:MAG TPA: nucleotidyltransferase domain-containing protein [bacterium (Candidatus Stahlbacteria)]|nr:nucleotidyltransferase domain-containing protein [Candidatus Stahlbacteria bacterium]
MPITIEHVRDSILSLGKCLDEAEGIGIFGSLARGDFSERSDIDIFVVIKDRKANEDSIWARRIKRVLRRHGRDVTVLVYTIKALKEICDWYVLRLASDAILLYDKAQKVEALFKEILKAAKRAGLVQRRVGDSLVWVKKNIKVGEIFKVEVNQ